MSVDRRRFLELVGAGALGVALGGCTGSDRAATVPASAAVSPSPSASPADWAALGRSLGGRLLRPGDPAYDTARLSANPRFDGVHPHGVARCRTAGDVRACVRFARDTGVPFAIRSGGHSYAGYSTSPGLVVDLSPMHQVSADAGTATVGAGARLIDVYDGLDAHGLALAGGSCPTVGIGGLTLGGGIGVVTRERGLTCDALRSAQVATADGDLVTASADSHPDLFWALRGGGGSFGAVTSFTFDTYAAGPLTLVFLSWPWARAADVLRAWQPWSTGAPDAMWSNCHLLSRPGEPTPGVSVQLVSSAGAEASARHVDALAAAVGSSPTTRSQETVPYRHAMLVEAGCARRSVGQCHFQIHGGQLHRQPEDGRSHLLVSPLVTAGIDQIVSAVEDRQRMTGLAEGGAAFDALGGAVARVGAADTAWVHRDVVISVQYTAVWDTGASADVVTRNEHWMHDTYAAMRTHVGGQAYQNYVDPHLPDPHQAYYGANYPRLQRVKAAYDPHDLFHVPEGVAPPGR